MLVIMGIALEMGIEAADAIDFDEIESVWWSSVQATHHFIDEAI